MMQELQNIMDEITEMAGTTDAPESVLTAAASLIIAERNQVKVLLSRCQSVAGELNRARIAHD